MTHFSVFSVLDFYIDGSRTVPAVYAQVLEQIVAADQLGFDAYWIGEHHGYLTPSHALVCPNPAVLLAAAAQRTRRIGLNTAVANLSVRHPLLIAEDYALVDLLSQGRLGLGMGRGSFDHEYAAFGHNRQESWGRFEESWEILQRAWRGETVTFHGQYYSLDQFKLSVLPVQQPFPRYWFSAVKDGAFIARGRAAQPVIGLPHLMGKSFPMLAQLVETYQQHYLAAGGDAEKYELPLIFFTCVAPTRAEAQQQAKEALAKYLVHQHHNAADHLHQIMQQMEEREHLWFGAPEDLVRLIKRYQTSMDSRHFVFWLDFGGMQPELVHRSLQFLAREVIPLVRA